MADLCTREVSERLISYSPTETTNELYDLGKMLVGECVERVHKIDSKATMLTGYSGTIIALMVSTSSIWKPTIDRWAVGIVLAAAFSALMSGAYALSSFSPQTFQWFSDTAWFDQDYLADVEQLRRYHISVMHKVIQSHDAISKIKTGRLRSAQWLLGVSTLLLVFALLDATWKAS